MAFLASFGSKIYYVWHLLTTKTWQPCSVSLGFKTRNRS